MKRHLVDKEPVSYICDALSIQPNLFYQWQRRFFENGAAAFERKSTKKDKREADRVEALESKLCKKDGVIAELMQDSTQKTHFFKYLQI